MFRKIKNNNKGHSGLNFCLILMLSLVLILMLLDVTRMFRLKSTLVTETESLASAFAYQGGFLNSAPEGWTDFYSQSSYVTANSALTNFKAVMVSAGAENGNKKPKIYINNNELVTTKQLSYQETGVFKGSCGYVMKYLKLAGRATSKVYTLEHSVPVCGFWIFKNTGI